MSTPQEMLADEIRELLEDKGHYLGYRIIHAIADLFEGYIETLDQCSGPVSGEDDRIVELKRKHAKEVECLEHIEDCYRQSVAQRRGCFVSDVRIDEQGRVTYRPM